MLKIKLKIKGMGCAHCERAIEKAIMGLKGVKSVKADAAAGTAEVEAEVLDKPELERAVQEAGYEVVGIID
jgi:copper chaperone CopZ